MSTENMVSVSLITDIWTSSTSYVRSLLVLSALGILSTVLVISQYLNAKQPVLKCFLIDFYIQGVFFAAFRLAP